MRGIRVGEKGGWINIGGKRIREMCRENGIKRKRNGFRHIDFWFTWNILNYLASELILWWFRQARIAITSSHTYYSRHILMYIISICHSFYFRHLCVCIMSWYHTSLNTPDEAACQHPNGSNRTRCCLGGRT